MKRGEELRVGVQTDIGAVRIFFGACHVEVAAVDENTFALLEELFLFIDKKADPADGNQAELDLLMLVPGNVPPDVSAHDGVIHSHGKGRRAVFRGFHAFSVDRYFGYLHCSLPQYCYIFSFYYDMQAKKNQYNDR